jgi:chemotaxis protein CheZ
MHAPRITADQALPEARARLRYIAQQSTQAAERVLLAVERARADHACLLASAQQLSGPADSLQALHAAAQRLDHQLTEILLSQEFHDLTGQVLARLLHLLEGLQPDTCVPATPAASAAPALPAASAALQGPVIDPHLHADVARDQQDVDTLLASLGF